MVIQISRTPCPLVSNTVWNIQTLQNQQKSIWEAVQRDIREAKSSLGTVKSSIQTGNDRLKTVPEGITLQTSLDEFVWMFRINRVLVTHRVSGVLFSGFGRGQ